MSGSTTEQCVRDLFDLKLLHHFRQAKILFAKEYDRMHDMFLLCTYWYAITTISQ